MNKNILILNGPNLNLLGEREQSQYGSLTLKEIETKCIKKCEELNLNLEFKQSNIEGEIVEIIQNCRNSKNGLIINAAGFTHTSVSIRDAISIIKFPVIELHISNIYKREEFRRKSLLSDVVSGGIFGLGFEGYTLAIKSIYEMIKNGN